MTSKHGIVDDGQPAPRSDWKRQLVLPARRIRYVVVVSYTKEDYRQEYFSTQREAGEFAASTCTTLPEMRRIGRAQFGAIVRWVWVVGTWCPVARKPFPSDETLFELEKQHAASTAKL